MSEADINVLVHSIVVIVIAIAAVINQWQHRKTRRTNGKQDGPNGP